MYNLKNIIGTIHFRIKLGKISNLFAPFSTEIVQWLFIFLKFPKEYFVWKVPTSPFEIEWILFTYKWLTVPWYTPPPPQKNDIKFLNFHVFNMTNVYGCDTIYHECKTYNSCSKKLFCHITTSILYALD